MSKNYRALTRDGLLLIAVGMPLMLGEVLGPRALPPFKEFGTAAYLAGLMLAVAGYVFMLRGLGPGPWKSFLNAAILLDGLACAGPAMALGEAFFPDVAFRESVRAVTYLPSVPLHLAAIAVLLWALGEIGLEFKIRLGRPELILCGILCLGAAIFHFVSAEEGRIHELFTMAILMGQFALLIPFLKIRAVMAAETDATKQG